MTRDETIEMAKNVGLLKDWMVPYDGEIEGLERFANLVEAMATAKAREACAKACEAVAEDLGGIAEGPFVTAFGKHTHQSMAAGAYNCAAVIRNGGQA